MFELPDKLECMNCFWFMAGVCPGNCGEEEEKELKELLSLHLPNFEVAGKIPDFVLKPPRR